MQLWNMLNKLSWKRNFCGNNYKVNEKLFYENK